MFFVIGILHTYVMFFVLFMTRAVNLSTADLILFVQSLKFQRIQLTKNLDQNMWVGKADVKIDVNLEFSETTHFLIATTEALSIEANNIHHSYQKTFSPY